MRTGQIGSRARRVVVSALLGALAMVALSSRTASATAITFNDLGCASPVVTEGAFSFSGATTVCNADYTDPSLYNNTSYGAFPGGDQNVIINNTGAGITLTSATPFNLYGIFGAMWDTNGATDPLASATVEIDGYLNGNLVGTVQETLADLFTYFSLYSVFGDNLLDTVVFLPDVSSNSDTFFLLDQMVLTPEPAQLALFGSGLFLLALALRRYGRRSKVAESVSGRL